MLFLGTFDVDVFVRVLQKVAKTRGIIYKI